VIWSFTQQGSVGVDWFRIEQEQIIGADNAQFIVNNPVVYADRIKRDAQGRLQIVSNQYNNQGSRTTSGVDLDFNYRWDLASGQSLGFKSVWSRLISYKQALVAGQAEINGAGNNQFGALPQWKNSTSLNWSVADWRSSLISSYSSSYEQKVATQSSNPGLQAKVASYTQLDAQFSYLGIADTELALSVANVTDRDPPFDPAVGGDYFDTSLYNHKGRTWTLSVSYQF